MNAGHTDDSYPLGTNVSISKSTDAAKTPGVFSSYQKFVATVLAFLQFTIVLDFMLLAPLGALVIPALKITPSQFGWLVYEDSFLKWVKSLDADD